MSTYFGNGYFLNVLQRGARPVGNAHSTRTPPQFQLEKTVETTGNQSPEVSSQTFEEVQSESPHHPASAATQPLNNDPLITPVSVEEPAALEVTTSFESHPAAEFPSGTSAHQTPETHTVDHEANAPLSSNDSLEASSSQVLSNSPVGPSAHAGSNESLFSAEKLQRVRSTSKVFELRMPENFFGQARRETSSTDQLKPVPQAHVVSADPDLQAESQPVDRSSALVTPSNTVIIPKHRNEVSELQTNELTKPGPVTDSQLTPQPVSVASEIVDEVKPNQIQPPRLIATQTLESLAPAPRAEPASEYVQPRQPLIAPAPVAPPARLQINRLDVQIINQAPAPPPQAARVTDVSQLLEKQLSRVGLLL